MRTKEARGSYYVTDGEIRLVAKSRLMISMIAPRRGVLPAFAYTSHAILSRLRNKRLNFPKEWIPWKTNSDNKYAALMTREKDEWQWEVYVSLCECVAPPGWHAGAIDDKRGEKNATLDTTSRGKGQRLIILTTAEYWSADKLFTRHHNSVVKIFLSYIIFLDDYFFQREREGEWNIVPRLRRAMSNFITIFLSRFARESAGVQRPDDRHYSRSSISLRIVWPSPSGGNAARRVLFQFDVIVATSASWRY